MALAGLFRSYGEASAMESVSLRAAMVMPILLLQKPHARSKSRDHAHCLEKRLDLWKAGNIDALIQEGRTIQSQLCTGRSHGSGDDHEQHTTQMFVRLMTNRARSKQLCGFWTHSARVRFFPSTALYHQAMSTLTPGYSNSSRHLT